MNFFLKSSFLKMLLSSLAVFAIPAEVIYLYLFGGVWGSW